MWESRCVGTRRGAQAHSQGGLGMRPGERSVVSSLIHVLTYLCEHVSSKSYTTNPSVMSFEINPLCHPSFSIRTHHYKHTNLHASTHTYIFIPHMQEYFKRYDADTSVSTSVVEISPVSTTRPSIPAPTRSPIPPVSLSSTLDVQPRSEPAMSVHF